MALSLQLVGAGVGTWHKQNSCYPRSSGRGWWGRSKESKRQQGKWEKEDQPLFLSGLLHNAVYNLARYWGIATQTRKQKKKDEADVQREGGGRDFLSLLTQSLVVSLRPIDFVLKIALQHSLYPSSLMLSPPPPPPLFPPISPSTDSSLGGTENTGVKWWQDRGTWRQLRVCD